MNSKERAYQAALAVIATTEPEAGITVGQAAQFAEVKFYQVRQLARVVLADERQNAPTD